MNTNFLDSVTNFLKKRTFELLGLILVLSSVALAIAFTTYSPEDPSFVYGDRSFEIQNFFGIYGSSIADFLLQSFGLASFLLLLNFLFWGLDLIIKKELRRIILKLFLHLLLYLNQGFILPLWNASEETSKFKDKFLFKNRILVKAFTANIIFSLGVKFSFHELGSLDHRVLIKFLI